MPGLGCLFGDISGEELVLEIVALEACVEDSNSVVRVAAGKLDIADVTAMEAVIVFVAAVLLSAGTDIVSVSCNRCRPKLEPQSGYYDYYYCYFC